MFDFFFLYFSYFSTLPILLFLLGLWGIVVVRRNLIIILISIEVLLLAVNLAFILNSLFLDDVWGQLIALYVLTIAGAESAIGLAILVAFYRLQSLLSVDLVSFLKG